MTLNQRARVASWLLLAVTALLPAVAKAGELPYNGTWTIQRISDSVVQFGVRARTANDTYEDDHAVPLSRFNGLSASALAGSGDVRFDVVSDPGTLHCMGAVRSGNGGGTYTYEPNSHFATALEQRSMISPSPQQQYRMTLGGVTLAFIDVLRADGYHPTTDAIIELMDHGVDERYVRGLSAAGLRPKSTDEVVRARDHGVTVDYIRAMADAGYHTTNVDELIRMRDHGVSSAFAAGLRARSFNASAEDLIRLMDHGVSLAYIDRLRAHGYHPTIDELIRLRDAGV